MSFIKNHLHFSIFYLFIILCNILFMYFLTDYRMVSKPMIVASLLGFYISTDKPPSNLFTLALIAALFGDIFLMFPHDVFFMMGLGSFLIMQVIYSVIFLRFQQAANSLQKAGIFMVFLFSCIFLYTAWPFLADMKLPVSLYTLCISGMVITALLGKTDSAGYTFVTMGAILFMISDSLLAWNKFVSPFSLADPVIMLSYMGAQFLIVSGVILNTNVKCSI
jgi:uncharacterized membrane protein YhhN